VEELRTVTYQSEDTLVIVFGAGGRLGQAMLPILAAESWVVVGVAREKKPPNLPPTMHWIQIDVTEVDLWEQSLRVFCGMASIYKQVIVIDLLLDKATVTTMRRSLTAGSAYISELRSRLATADRPSSLVLASTTAVLSPWLYQTPYGLAKRRQLAQYSSTGMAGRAILLPSLVHVYNEASTAPARLVLTYNAAAVRMVRAATSARTAPPTTLCLVAQGVDCGFGAPVDVPRVRAAVRVAKLHLASWTTQRDSPQAHRLASNGRLLLTPQPLRQRVDHHVLPSSLLHQVARRLGVEVEEDDL
jgi:hypothetical protein